MPVWAVAPFFGACSAPTQLELPFWAIWFRCLFQQCRLCSGLCVSTVALAGVPVLSWSFVRVVCAAFVVFCCLARLLLLLGSPAFAAAPGLFWYASTRLPCTPDFPVRVPVQYPLLPAPALEFVLLRLLLVTVCELGWFCAPACACSHASLVWLTCSCLSLSSCV